MTDHEPMRECAEIDRHAILERREFLVKSALAAAALTVGVSGCAEAEVCLSIVAPQDADTADGDAADATDSEPQPEICLIAPFPDADVGPDVTKDSAQGA